MASSPRQVAARNPVDRAKKGPVRAMQWVRASTYRQSLTRCQRSLSTSHGVAVTPQVLQTFSPVRWLWTSVAEVG